MVVGRTRLGRESRSGRRRRLSDDAYASPGRRDRSCYAAALAILLRSLLGCAGYFAARRARAARRFSERRSSSESPPHTPESWLCSIAHWRQVSLTWQVLHTVLARSICTSAGPVFPTGKNSSGSSTSRHAARSRQSIKSPHTKKERRFTSGEFAASSRSCEHVRIVNNR